MRVLAIRGSKQIINSFESNDLVRYMKRIALFLFVLNLNAAVAGQGELIRLLSSKACINCDLADSQLMQSQLRDSRLSGSILKNSNLSGADLRGSDLSGVDLSYANLSGANLQGADLRGAILFRTDLRNSLLHSTKLDVDALNNSIWYGAHGINYRMLGESSLYIYLKALIDEEDFGTSEVVASTLIARNKEDSQPWLIRGIVRNALGKLDQASADLLYAEKLALRANQVLLSNEIRDLRTRINSSSPPKGGNGIGISLGKAGGKVISLLGPMVIKSFLRLGL